MQPPLTEFQKIYRHLRQIWRLEALRGDHRNGGFDAHLSRLIGRSQTAICTGKQGYAPVYLTMQNIRAIAIRFGVSVDHIIEVALEKPEGYLEPETQAEEVADEVTQA